MQRASVDLPHPVSPTRPSTSPLNTETSTSSTALTASGARPRRRASRGCFKGKYLRSARTSSCGSEVAITGGTSAMGHHRLRSGGFYAALGVDTGRGVIVSDRHEGEVALAAVVLHVRAAWVETTAGRWRQ